MTGGSSYELHVEHAAAAIAAGLCDVVVGVYAATPRGDRARRRRRATRTDARAEPDARMGDAVRPAHADGRVRARRQPPHGGVRHHVGATRADRGRHAPLGSPQPERPLPGTDHGRRRARVADAGVAVAPARLLPRHRRRRRVRDDVGRARAISTKPPVYVLGAATCTRPLDDQRDARPRDHRRRDLAARRRSSRPGSRPTTSTC